MKLKNQSGATIMEILIAVAIAGAVALGGVTLIRNLLQAQKESSARLTTATLEKLFESHANSRTGCTDLIDKKIGSVITMDIANIDFAAGTKIQDATIEDLRMVDFLPVDPASSRGITNLVLTLKRNGKRLIRTVPVGVIVKSSGGDLVVESCVLSPKEIEEEIKKRVCGDTYGPLTKGMTCEEAAKFVKRHLIEKICSELNQGDAAEWNGESCALNLLHANQTCGAGKLANGFDMNGNIICNGAPIVTTPPPTCASWTAWTPSESLHCPDELIDQSRSCNDGIVTLTENQKVYGTKSDCGSVSCSISYRAKNDKETSPLKSNGVWALYKNGADKDCDDAGGCGIIMGLTCTGSNRVRLIYAYQEGSVESFEVTTPWSSPGTLTWGGWAATYTGIKDECQGTRNCGLRVRAEVEKPGAKCTVSYQYKNEKKTSTPASDGNWSVINNSGGEDENCDDGSGCGIQATISCTGT